LVVINIYGLEIAPELLSSLSGGMASSDSVWYFRC